MLVLGWFIGEGRSLDNAKRMSRTKDEKEVKEPQKPVARPIYNGIVFLSLLWAALAVSGSEFSSWVFSGKGVPHPWRNNL